MQLTSLGHSCLLVEAADTRLLFDPGVFTGPLDAATDLHAIVVTHQHADHLDTARIVDLVRANPAAVVLADSESAQILAGLGVDATANEAGRQTQVGGLALTGVGQWHAFNHEWMPTVSNVGVLVRADGEPTLYHPGDAYDGEVTDVDILAVPINAPWTPVRDSIAFVRRVAPGRIVPIHDALLSASGRGLYLGHIATNGGAPVTDLAGDATATVGV
jgi:L-ascorbate metabolism protein UlaG (beta-lactamase superfamily)